MKYIFELLGTNKSPRSKHKLNLTLIFRGMSKSLWNQKSQVSWVKTLELTEFYEINTAENLNILKQQKNVLEWCVFQECSL